MAFMPKWLIFSHSESCGLAAFRGIDFIGHDVANGVPATTSEFAELD